MLRLMHCCALHTALVTDLGPDIGVMSAPFVTSLSEAFPNAVFKPEKWSKLNKNIFFKISSIGHLIGEIKICHGI